MQIIGKVIDIDVPDPLVIQLVGVADANAEAGLIDDLHWRHLKHFGVTALQEEPKCPIGSLGSTDSNAVENVQQHDHPLPSLSSFK